MLGARKPKKWIQGAISHPGAEKAAAARNGRSTLEEANAESKSSDPHIRSRGLLAKRFISHKI
jgi:hypothetical protein